MIGKNQLILNDETVIEIVENYFKNLSGTLGFTVTDVEREDYKNQWKITLEGKEAIDEQSI